MKRPTLCAWTVLIATLIVARVYAQPASTVRLAVAPIPIFNTFDGEQAGGFNVEAVTGIATTAGLPIELVNLPLNAIAQAQAADPALLASSIPRTPDNEQEYHWITPLTASHTALFVSRLHPLAGRKDVSLSDVASIATVRGDYRHALVQEHARSQVLAFETWREAIEAVLQGRAEGVFFTQIGLHMACEQAQLNCASLIPVVNWNTSYNYLALKKHPGNGPLAARLTDAAVRFKASEAFPALVGQTVEQLNHRQIPVAVQDGVISFTRPLELAADNLWIIAANVPYFSEPEQGADVTGFAADLVKAILSEADVTQPILTAPWERVLRESARHPNVVAFPVARTPEREHLFHWITPITRNRHSLFATTAQPVASLEQLPDNAVVAVLRNDFRGDIAREAGVHTLAYDSWPEVVGALLQGDADYLFGSQFAVRLGCEQRNASCNEITRVYNYQAVETYVVLSKADTNPILAERLKRAAQQVKSSADFQRWASAWSQQVRQRHNLEQHVDDGVVNLWNKDE